MARTLRIENDTLYRAVLIAPGGAVVGIYGPYDRRADATRIGNTKAASRWHIPAGTTVRVESSPIAWTEVVK